MAKRGREMSAKDGRSQLLFVSAADGLDEIREMIGIGLAFFDFLSVFVNNFVTVVTGHQDVSPFAFDYDSDGAAFVIVHFRGTGLFRQTPHLHYERRLLVIVKHDQRIGRLRIVLVSKTAADG